MRRIVIIFASASSLHAQSLLVENGLPRAEIVISGSPARMQRVAAHEFRMQIEKISGARLPIVTQPGGKAVKVFIGASAHNPVKVNGLKDGAYRITTGPDWLALVGDDSDFTPVGPFARNNGDIQRAQAEFEQIMGAPYGMPNAGLYKNRLKLPGDTGKPDGAVTAKNETLDIWGLDERGSFNAVCGFLHKLGARWYLPGELGEVLPSMKTIALPKLDETVKPDFALRQFNFRLGVVGPETALWTMRLGMRNDERLQIAHGMATMTNRGEVFAKHPEWFALYGGKRDFRLGDSKCQLCYSNDELFRETVRYARAQLDTFKLDSVSIMPPDGYTSICQCEKCKGKDSPERNERGLLSDYVWDFANRVAKEVGKTHPQAKVLNCAYGVYTLPPLKIDKLEPNMLVCIVGGRRPIDKAGSKGEGESAPGALRAAWVKKTDNPLLIFENYPFTDRGWYLPSFAAHSLGDSVKATKGMSQGEDIWLSVRQDFDKVGIGVNHFLVYYTARAYWGGHESEAALREYCCLFYGPAELEMLAFFNYCEANWRVMDEDKAKTDEALALFEKAKVKTNAASVYSRRIALIDDFLKGLRMKSQQLGQKRGPVPVVRLVGDAENIVIDGRLDDEYWQTCPTAATGRLRELQTGRTPTFGTSFKAGWQGGSLYFAIRCDERPGEKPNITSTREDDPAIWHGDAIEIELATETHSYYQVAVSPAGHIVDLDRGAPRGQWFTWDSKAEVATHVADDHWTVEIRLPVTQDENDPLHQVIGRKPTQSLPWHINLCRQRIREDHFYDGRSHKFEAAEMEEGYLKTSRAADELMKNLKLEEAFTALVEFADGEAGDFQKAAALEQAAGYALTGKRFDLAGEVIDWIPIPAVEKTVRMRFLLARQQAPEVVARFGNEDIAKWPFWKRGDGFHARGRAYFIAKAGDKAEADLKAALEFTREPRTRDSVLLMLAQNREQHLKNDDAALMSYHAIVDERKQFGGADEFAALQGIARILTRRGQSDEALAVLNRVDAGKLPGVWKASIAKSIEEVRKARK